MVGKFRSGGGEHGLEAVSNREREDHARTVVVCAEKT